jgi:hypothetical protein
MHALDPHLLAVTDYHLRCVLAYGTAEELLVRNLQTVQKVQQHHPVAEAYKMPLAVIYNGDILLQLGLAMFMLSP